MSHLEVYNAITNADKLLLQELYYRARKTITIIPIRMNCNRMIYGGMIELAVADLLKSISDVIEFDKIRKNGSEYKVDVQIMDVKISLKACANVGSDIVIINKFNKDAHDIRGMVILVFFVREGKLALFPIEIMMPTYIKNNGANISIRGSSWNKVLKNSKYIIDLPELSEDQKESLKTLQEIDARQELYDKYIR